MGPHMVIFKVFAQFNHPVLCPHEHNHTCHTSTSISFMIQKIIPLGGAPYWGLWPHFCHNHNNRVPVRTKAELSILHGLSHNQPVINPATIQGASKTDVQSGRPRKSCNACRFHPCKERSSEAAWSHFVICGLYIVTNGVGLRGSV